MARRDRIVSRDYEVFGDEGVPAAIVCMAPATANDPTMKRARDQEVFGDGDGRVIPAADATLSRASRRRRSSRDYEVFGDDAIDELVPTGAFGDNMTGARNAEVFEGHDVIEIYADDAKLPAKQPFMQGSRDQEVFGLGEAGSLSVGTTNESRRASGRDDEY